MAEGESTFDAPTIRFWGGIGTIGGTRIVVSEAGDRVIFDFGLAYAPGEVYYDSRLQPDPGAVLEEYLALGLAPPIPHLYRGETGRGPGQTAVFISHLHLDHHALTDLVAPDIPVYMHAESCRMQQVLRAVGEATPGLPRSYTPFAWGASIRVGRSLRVTPVPVDHDIPGAGALLVETAAGAVVYTGDLRLHGAHPERVWQFIAQARSLRPVALLIEGTHLGGGAPDQTPPLPETEVPDRAAALLQPCRALACITLYPRNTERITALKRAARAAGRTLALESQAAAIYTGCGDSLHGAALYLTGAERTALAEGTAPAWLQALVGEAAAADAPVVGAPEVREAQDRWLVQLSYPKLAELVHLRPAPGAIFLHSNGEPLGPFDPAYAVYQRWLQRFGMALVPLRSSGHAAPEHLHLIAAEIGAGTVVPIHTLHPEGLELPGTPRLLPAYGACYRLDQLG